MTSSFLGSVAQIIPDITEQFNRKYQDNQLAIAQQEAIEAQALAAASRNNTNNQSNTGMYLLIGVAVVGIGLLFFKLTRP